MKRDFLEGLGLEKEVIDKIMAENGADLEREKAKTTAAKADLADMQGKLANVTAELDTLKKNNGNVAAVQKKLDELQAKYDSDTASLQAKITDREYSDAIANAISKKGLKFSSKSAEKAFTAALREKKLELKDGEFVELDDFIKVQQEADPDAFLSGDPPIKISTGASLGGGKVSMSKDEIMQIKDPIERQTAIAENVELFQKG